jgi:aspartyl-tRNA(Asn)/glutamyl-tRNA(Gln) amidotransferase subunit C
MPRPELSIRHVARLARLELTAAEAGSMQVQLDKILAHIEKLRELDLGGLGPDEVPDRVPPLREDTPHPGLDAAAALANAPAQSREQFQVPRVIDTE